jgi:hypothetical protein
VSIDGILELFALLLFMSLFVCLALLTREMKANAKLRACNPEERQFRIMGKVWTGLFVWCLVIGVWFVIYLARQAL